MTEPVCPKCGEELEHVNPGIEDLYINDPNDGFEDSFVGREYKCNNRECPAKKIEAFWDFTRVEVDGKEVTL